ncbi:ABC transporter [Cellulomonas sp. NPDC055163]
MLDQLDDYLLPRLRAENAPLLVVVGGSTGAGKSTLVNSLLGEQVTTSGVLRPTTRWPVLVHHPLDARWFSTDRVLPGLARLVGARVDLAKSAADGGGAAASGSAGWSGGAGATGGGAAVPGGPGGGSGGGVSTAAHLTGPAATATDGHGAGLRLVSSPALPPGLALLDAPDIDSVVEENRALATQLLAAADLWLFVTTAARYADAVPWELLGAAARRRVHLALVLDRVDDGTEALVSAHLRQMLDEHDLAEATVLLVPETSTDGGLLPEVAVGAVADWLTALGGDPAARARVIRGTREGVTRDVLVRAEDLARAADDQRAADARLRAAVAAAYEDAATQVERATSDGTMLRGEVLARWQDVVGTGEFLRAVEQKVSGLRDRITAAFRGQRAPEPALAHAIGHGLEAVVLDAAEDAAERAHSAWRTDPAGVALLEGLALSRASGDLRGQVAEQIRGWQSDVLALVEREGADKRTTARAVSYGVNGLGAALMVAVFASTGGLTGAEVGIAGGAAILAQRLLEAVFGDEAVRQLAREAHERLAVRVRAVLAGQAARFTAQLDALGTADASGDPLRTAVAQVTAAAARAEGAAAASDAAPVAGVPGAEAGRLRGAGVLAHLAAERGNGFTGRDAPGGTTDGADAPLAPAGTSAQRTGAPSPGQPPEGRLRSWWRRVTGAPQDGQDA